MYFSNSSCIYSKERLRHLLAVPRVMWLRQQRLTLENLESQESIHWSKIIFSPANFLHQILSSEQNVRGYLQAMTDK